MTDLIRSVLGPGGILSQVFPGYEHRPQQLEMAEAVEGLLHDGGVMLAEAATGTGKSLAYLIPSLYAGTPVVISTGTRNLQEQLFKKDIPLVSRLTGKEVKSVLMKGRNNYLCWRRFQSFLQSDTALTRPEKLLLDQIARWGQSSDTGDRSEIEALPDDSWIWSEIASRADSCSGSRCEHHGSCFVFRLKMKAQSAGIVVINHHLFFADALLRQTRQISSLPYPAALIFDEAHLLDDIAMRFFGVHCGQQEVDELIHHVRQYKKVKKRSRQRKKDPFLSSLVSVQDRSRIFFSRFGQGEGRFSLSGRFDQEASTFAERLVESVRGLSVFVSSDPEIPDDFKDEIQNRSAGFCSRLGFISARNESGFVYWGEYQSRGNWFHATPLDIASDFSSIILNQDIPVLMTSATLTAGGSFGYIKTILGMESALECSFSTPFDHPSQGILYLPMHLPDPQHPEFTRQCCMEILEILNVTQGRAFVLSTSYRAMHEIAGYLDGRIPYTLFVQGQAPKHTLIERFKTDRHSVLVATSSFWQGVDVPGDALTCVIIDKLPFSSPSDPVTEARIQRIRDLGGDPFHEYQVPEAVIALKQGVGRLIRSRTDIGVVAILDRRIGTRGYGNIFLTSLPDFRKVSDLSHVREFLTIARG